MNILVTGGSGFLGYHIVEQALLAGHRVRAMVRKTSKTDTLERLGAEIVRGDLKDPESMRQAVEGIDGVINAASSMDGMTQETEAATIRGTRDLLLAAEEAGVRRFVHISSIGIYAVRRLSQDELIAEDFPLESDPKYMSLYVRSKIASEAAAVEFSARGKMNVIILRPGILYGPRGIWKLPRTGYSLGKNLYAILGNGKNPLPVCYVENCANAAIVGLENSAVTNGIFNIVDDDRITQSEFMNRLRRDAMPNLRVVRVPYALAYAFTSVGERLGKLLKLPFPFRTTHVVICGWRTRYSNDRAKNVLGWRPRLNKEEGMARTMNFYAARNRPSHRADLKALQQIQVITPPIETCIIGCGVIAEEHIQILKKLHGVKLTGICDTNPEAARMTASKFGISSYYDDVRAMLSKERPQTVHIVTPPQSHASLTEIAVQAGCDVLVEKPMALNAKEARKMAEIAAKHGKKLCVDHNHMYDPVFVRARRIVESGELGDILWVESYYGFNLGSNPESRYMLPGAEKHWTFQLPGGLYQNLASHPLSLALDVLGKPTKIHAHARYGRVLPHAPTDELRILMETPTASGMAVVSLAASPRSHYVNIYGTKMSICVDVLDKWIIIKETMNGVPKPISRAVMHLKHGTTVLGGTIGGTFKVILGTWSYVEGMDLLIRDFYASIRENRAPPVTAEEGIWTMEIMDEVWQQLGMTGGKTQEGQPHPLLSV